MSAVETMTVSWLWAHIIVIAVATFVIRVSFIGATGHITIPDDVKEHMTLIPAAVLAALAVPPLVYRDGAYHLSIFGPFLIAGVAAVVVAWRTENLVATIVVGFFGVFRGRVCHRVLSGLMARDDGGNTNDTQGAVILLSILDSLNNRDVSLNLNQIIYQK